MQMGDDADVVVEDVSVCGVRTHANCPASLNRSADALETLDGSDDAPDNCDSLAQKNVLLDVADSSLPRVDSKLPLEDPTLDHRRSIIFHDSFPPLETDAAMESSSQKFVAPAAETAAAQHTSIPCISISDSIQKDALRRMLPLRFHNMTWSVSSQEGYKITDPIHRIRSKLHTDMEDVHLPRMHNASSMHPETTDYPKISSKYMSKSGAKVFVLADGHGGGDAPRFFVQRVSKSIVQILDSREWDLSLVDHRTLLSTEITGSFKLLDVEYQAVKVAQYRAWLDSGSSSNKKPKDDGCTMIANIVMDQWIVNCNVGDSRTVIGAKLPFPPNMLHSQSSQQPSSNWIQLYASEDHNMMHPEKIESIHANGGRFLDPQGACFLSINIEPAQSRNRKPYTELNGARIFRPMTPSVRAVGCSHRRTLNLSATLGDLLFKIEPAILSSTPDIRFIKLEEGMDYVLVAATDGVWDHLNVHYPPTVQNDRVLSFITRIVQSDANPYGDAEADSANVVDMDSSSSTETETVPSFLKDDEPIHSSVSHRSPKRAKPIPTRIPSTKTNQALPERHALFNRLAYCTDVLVHREPAIAKLPDEGLFVPNLIRYDDATAMVLYFSYRSETASNEDTPAKELMREPSTQPPIHNQQQQEVASDKKSSLSNVHPRR